MAEDKHTKPEDPPSKPQDDKAGEAAGEGKKQPQQPPQQSTTGADKSARKTEKTTAAKAKPKAAGDKGNAPDKDGDKAGDKATETKDKDGDKGKTPPPPKAGTRGGSGGKPPKSGLLFRALFTLAIIAVLGVAGYYAWQEYGNQWRQAPKDTADAPTEEPSDTEEADADNELARQVRQLEGRLESEIRAQREETETLRDQVAELQLQLSSQGERLHQLATATREDWLLAEAEYLLRLASQRILTERQTGNAIALMETADRILRDMDQPDLFPVRKALAEDINALRMAGTLDREGLYLRLEALRNAVDELGLDTLPRAAETPGGETAATDAEPETAPEPEPEAPWYTHLITNARAAFGDMAGLVRVERRDVPLRPMLTADQEAALRHNLRIFMEQAQLALMQENEMVYQSSLAKAEHWIDNHFEDSRATRVVLEELTALREKDIAPERPGINRSINALKDYIDYWHNRHRIGSEQESAQ